MARPRRPALNPRLGEFRVRRGFTQEQVAEALGITPEMVRRHEKGLAQPSERYRVLYSRFYAASQADLGLLTSSPDPVAAGPLLTIDDLIAEISSSATRDESIHQLDLATHSIADAHSSVPAVQVLREVMRLHGQARELASRPQRLSQTRELFRIESNLLAHACLVLGDLHRNAEAHKYGKVALSMAQEAGCNEAISRSVLAKTLRWDNRLAESATMARLGFDTCNDSPIRVQLASQEANAAALMGDTQRAVEALTRAGTTAERTDSSSGTSAWSFPTARQAVFALSVATKTGNPDAALAAAQLADESWKSGAPVIKANWAQIRIGASVARLAKGELDGAIAEVTPVLSLRPDLRVSTVTAYMDDLDRRLRQPKLRTNRQVVDLRRHIHDFNKDALLNWRTENLS